MTYKLEGSMLEVCTCDAICPCWIGQDPDGGSCQGSIAWHFNKGDVNGCDVSGLTLAIIVQIPGNALAGNWRAVVFVDDSASTEQEQALLDVYTGKLGGPVADLVQLIGEVVAVERAPITFDVHECKGQLKIGNKLSAEMDALVGATGEQTTLHDAAFSVIKNAPAFVGTASTFNVKDDTLGVVLDLQGKSSVQGSFVFEA